MSDFRVGDVVRMPGVPVEVEVLETGVPCDEEGCAAELFRFTDPATGAPDRMHADEFVLVRRGERAEDG